MKSLLNTGKTPAEVAEVGLSVASCQKSRQVLQFIKAKYLILKVARMHGIFLLLGVVTKIKGLYYLNRSESVDYLVKAYDLKWCLTKWQNGKIKVSCETMDKYRGYSLSIHIKSKNQNQYNFRKKN